jgi:hypothetical protein
MLFAVPVAFLSVVPIAFLSVIPRSVLFAAPGIVPFAIPPAPGLFVAFGTLLLFVCGTPSTPPVSLSFMVLTALRVMTAGALRFATGDTLLTSPDRHHRRGRSALTALAALRRSTNRLAL